MREIIKRLKTRAKKAYTKRAVKNSKVFKEAKIAGDQARRSRRNREWVEEMIHQTGFGDAFKEEVRNWRASQTVNDDFRRANTKTILQEEIPHAFRRQLKRDALLLGGVIAGGVGATILAKKARKKYLKDKTRKASATRRRRRR